MGTKIGHTYSTCSLCGSSARTFARERINPGNCFHRIVTGDEIWLYYYNLLRQLEIKVWKKPGEEIPTRLCRTRPAEKNMTVIFWDKYGTLLTEYLPGGARIGGPYYVSIIEQLRYATLERHSDRVLFHDDGLVHKCNIV